MSEFKNRVVQILESRGAGRPCARCGHAHFTLLDDFARIDVQREFQKISLGGMAVPCVMIACNNCGDVSFHAVGVLGLLDEVNKSPQKEVEAKKGESNE